MATPNNLLEQLIMQGREPRDPLAPVPESTAPLEDQLLATLLSQSLQPGERVPPAGVVRPQLAQDFGMTEEDLTLSLLGAQNLINTGTAPAGSGSLTGVLAQDRGLDTQTMESLVRGNASLANVDSKAQETATQGRQATVAASQSALEPTSDMVLEGLLSEARSVTDRADPDAKAAFQNKLGRFMRGADSSPAQRKAAYQLRHPDLTVEVQDDGIMSFSDKGPGLQIKDEKTRRAVENMRAQLEILSPDQPIVVGEGSEIAALAATTKQRIADNVMESRTKLFGPPTSKAAGDIQARLQGIVDIQDPNERAIALQRLGPSIAAYGNQRRSELRNEVFADLGINSMERDLAMQEQRDRSDPRWDEFRRDSPYTASLRAQLRQAKSDGLSQIDQRVQSDPMLNTLQSQTTMTEAIVAQQGKADSAVQLSDRIGSLAPQQQSRLNTAMQSLHPGKDVSTLSEPDKAKMFLVDEEFYGAVAALDSPAKTVAMMSTDSGNAKKWRSYLKQAELSAGADEATADMLANTYTNMANGSAMILSGGMGEDELANQGGTVLAIKEQWDAEKSSLSPSEFAARRDNYYLPRMIEAKIDYLQTQEMTKADQTYDNLQPNTAHEGVNALLTEAREQGYKLGDLMNPRKLVQLQASQPQTVTSAPGRYGTSVYQSESKIGIFADANARAALSQYIASARKERMLNTAFLTPIDTTRDVERKLQVAAVTSVTTQGATP